MVQLLSYVDSVITINDHEFTGRASEEPWYEISTEGDLVETSIGGDGGMYGLVKAMFGGDLTIKLQPASPSTKWCIQEREMWLNDLKEGRKHKTYRGTIQMQSQGSSWALEGGVILRPGIIFVPNQTYEMVFRFEQITSNVDGGDFQPPLSGDGGSAGGIDDSFFEGF